jgi:hypothetical protein
MKHYAIKMHGRVDVSVSIYFALVLVGGQLYAPEEVSMVPTG